MHTDMGGGGGWGLGNINQTEALFQYALFTEGG